MFLTCQSCGTEFPDDNKYYRRKTCSDACDRALRSKIQYSLYNAMKSDYINKNNDIKRNVISKYVGNVLESSKIRGKLPKRISRNDMESKVISHYNPISYYTIKFRRRCITMVMPQYGYAVDVKNPYKDDVWFVLTRSCQHAKIDQSKTNLQDVRGRI
jgi:hypothetical protein